MKKRRVIILALAVVAVLAGVIWWAVASRPPAVPDPVYDGHPISYWVDSYAPGRVKGRFVTYPSNASLDSNALPYLAGALKRRDGPWRTEYNRLFYHLPDWLQNHAPIPKYAAAERSFSCQILESMGTNARPVIPELIDVLNSNDPGETRASAAAALGYIANRDDKPVGEALAAARNDKDRSVQAAARVALTLISLEKFGRVNY